MARAKEAGAERAGVCAVRGDGRPSEPRCGRREEGDEAPGRDGDGEDDGGGAARATSSESKG